MAYDPRLTTPGGAEARLTTRTIQVEAEWDALRGAWNELFAACPAAAPPLDFTWLRTWWSVYHASLRAAELRIVTVWRQQRLIGALPLYLRRGRGGPLGVRGLGFISTGEPELEETCPEYLNVLYLPGEEAECALAAWQAIERMAWDHLELLDVPQGALLLEAERGFAKVQRQPRGSCPVADLSGGFEAYLAKLSANSRQQARRLLREAKRAGACFELVGAHRCAGAFDDLARLHQERWNAEGKPGVFAAPRFVAFHRGLVSEWLPAGRALLARLMFEGKPVAVLYGFVTGQRFDFYQSGVRAESIGPLRSPGTLAHLLLMKALTERGVTAYDFLRGNSPYKMRLATRQNELFALHIWRPTLRTTLHRALQFAARLLHKSRRIVK